MRYENFQYHLLMDLKPLRAFVLIARHGSITRAAASLHLSQSALSLQLKALQDSVGANLFRRTSRGMELLPGGRELLPYAEGVVAAAAEFDAAAARLSRRIAGTLPAGHHPRSGFPAARCPAGADAGALSVGADRRFARHLRLGAGAGRGRAFDAGFYLGQPQDPRLHVAMLTPFRYRVVAHASGRTESLTQIGRSCPACRGSGRRRSRCTTGC